MNSNSLLLIVLAVCFLADGCQRPLIIDDDPPPGTDAKWSLVSFQSERLIQRLYATPTELYAISENQFCRFNKNNELLEQRQLDADYGVRGIPELSEHTFVRMTNDSQTRQVVEFHLSRNSSQVVKIVADDLASPADNFLEVEFLARTLGAFNDNGTLFLLPSRVFPSRKYAFFLFEIVQNSAHTAFVSVNVIHRIDLDDLSADFANLVNIRFLDGNFYVTAREGAWRIKSSGEVEKISQEWVRDVFTWQNKLYITGFNNTDLLESSDSGLTWKKLEHSSGLKMVEVTGGLMFTQEVLGIPYQLEKNDFSKAQKIVYPENVSYDPLIYYGTAFHEGQYYFSIDKEIYFTKEVAVE